MCGRYAAAKRTDELVEEFEVADDRTGEPVVSLLKSPQHPPPGEPDYNVAPAKAARVVLTRRAPTDEAGDDAPVRQLRLLTWGLVPSWASGPAVGVRMINARAEEAMTKRAFAPAVRSRRCLVPATGWYEWRQFADGGGVAEHRGSPGRGGMAGRRAGPTPRRQPFFMSRCDATTAALAGLYEFWRDPSRPHDDPAAWLVSFAIMTTEADPELRDIHDRQPLVLDRPDWADWLDPDMAADRVAGLLRFREPGRFVPRPVGAAVGNSRASGPGLIEPVPLVTGDPSDPAT